MPDIVHVLRILEYVGTREWVEHTIKNSIHGTRVVPHKGQITAVTLNEFPEALTAARADVTMGFEVAAGSPSDADKPGQE